MATVINGSDNFNTNNVATQDELDAGLGNITAGLGEGQTWQDVTSSRAVNTNYTNTTGRSIAVAVVFDSTNGAYDGASIWVDGVRLMEFNSNSTWDGGDTSVFAIVPNGSVYRAVPMQTNMETWRELR